MHRKQYISLKWLMIAVQIENLCLIPSYQFNTRQTLCSWYLLTTGGLQRHPPVSDGYFYSENARVCAKRQWNARLGDCVTGLHERRSRQCNPVTPIECVSLSFRTHPCVLAFITYIFCTNGFRWLLSDELNTKKLLVVTYFLNSQFVPLRCWVLVKHAI